MRLLTFADLHLGARKSSTAADIAALTDLQALIAAAKPDIVINCGDTVSKDSSLRDLSKKMDYWEQYKEFTASLACPVIETCLARERTLFSKIFNTEAEYVVVKDDVALISFNPLKHGDHTMTPEQLEWFSATVEQLAGKVMIFISHVPVAQTTVTRQVVPGMYLTQSEWLKQLAQTHAKYAVFIGGHFHSPPELPRAAANILMLMAGCFSPNKVNSMNAISPGKNRPYFRTIELKEQSITVHTHNAALNDILPVYYKNIKGIFV